MAFSQKKRAQRQMIHFFEAALAYSYLNNSNYFSSLRLGPGDVC